ncbi:MAG: right-handed parallel beta-helix repeat-containing protein [Actinomycetales bacterium]|nr:right-handed parallel beta-helix repeat-containing protein [Actinomycetales bacterium]
MNDIFRTLPVSLVLAGASATVSAETITVCADGCDYTSINAAIGAASDGDVIQLAAETYFEGEQIDPRGKAITLRGVLDKAGEPTSVLDGAGSHRVLICQRGETGSTVFEWLVIQNGSGSTGAGMINRNSSSPSLADCAFTSNSAHLGGGMYNSSSSPTLANCTFTGNTAYGGTGGGMSNNSSSPILTDCTFTGNSTSYSGGGIYNYLGSSPNLANCTFTGNAADYGGGMGNYYSSPTLADCTFENNSAEVGGGMYSYNSSFPTLTNCVFTDNSAEYGGGMYNDFASPNLADCTLCDNTPDQIDGSWTDAGDNCVATSCDDCDHPSDSCPTDLDRNGMTDGGDLGAFFIFWGECQVDDCLADFNDDEVVDGIDLGILFSAWGPCT